MARRIARRVPEPAPLPAPSKTETIGRFFQKHRDTGFIGVDGSLAGCAISVIADTGEYHCWRLQTDKVGVERLDEIERWAETRFDNIHLATTDVRAMLMEGYSFGSSNGRELLGEGGGMVKLAWLRSCRRFKRLPASSVLTPQQLKKYVVGSGAADVKKQHMLLATFKQWGVEFKDDNQCDAYGLARAARAWAMDPCPDELTKAQLEVLSKLPPHSELSRHLTHDPVLSI